MQTQLAIYLHARPPTCEILLPAWLTSGFIVQESLMQLFCFEGRRLLPQLFFCHFHEQCASLFFSALTGSVSMSLSQLSRSVYPITLWGNASYRQRMMAA